MAIALSSVYPRRKTSARTRRLRSVGSARHAARVPGLVSLAEWARFPAILIDITSVTVVG